MSFPSVYVRHYSTYLPSLRVPIKHELIRLQVKFILVVIFVYCGLNTGKYLCNVTHATLQPY